MNLLSKNSDYEEEDGFEGDEEEESEEEETQDYDGEQYEPTSEGAPSIEWHMLVKERMVKACS